MGHKVHFIATCGVNKYIFWAPVGNKSYATREKHLFIVALFLFRHQTWHSQNKIFLPGCTIYYIETGNSGQDLARLPFEMKLNGAISAWGVLLFIDSKLIGGKKK